MERVFMGLSSKESLAVVKEEMNNDGCKDSDFMKGSVVQWPFLNKVSAHLRSAIPSPDAFDSIKKCSVDQLQNMNGANVKQPLLGGMPVTAPHSVLPIIGAVAGMTKSCNTVKPSAPAPQLTIFYAGTVNVFDDISPEKAQAIILLAGNGLSALSAASNTAQPKDQPSSLKVSAGDGMLVSQSINIPPCSGLPSPLSVSSHTDARSGSGSSSNDEFLAAKASGVLTTSVSKVETPKVVNATTILPSAVPQARKASLARFLEKRKERVINVAPYNLNNKSEDVPMQNTMVANISAIIGTNTVSTKQG